MLKRFRFLNIAPVINILIVENVIGDSSLFKHHLLTRVVTIHLLRIRFVSRFLTHGSKHPTIFLNLISSLFKQYLYNN